MGRPYVAHWSPIAGPNVAHLDCHDRGQSLVALLARHLEDTAPNPRALNPDVPESLSLVILRALARRPDDRWPSAAELLQALERVQA